MNREEHLARLFRVYAHLDVDRDTVICGHLARVYAMIDALESEDMNKAARQEFISLLGAAVRYEDKLNLYDGAAPPTPKPAGGRMKREGEQPLERKDYYP